VVELHDAMALHFDFRVQVGEMFRLRAVPKGPQPAPLIISEISTVNGHGSFVRPLRQTPSPRHVDSLDGYVNLW
jgi:hypothetical protein